MYVSRRAWFAGVCMALFFANTSVQAQIPSGIESASRQVPLIALGSPDVATEKKDAALRAGSTSAKVGERITLTPGRSALQRTSADLSADGETLGVSSAGSDSSAGGNLRAAMPPVTEDESERARASQVFPDNLNEGAAIEPVKAGGKLQASGITGDTNARGPASIAELARSLRNNPDLIYQYVRNNIEYYPIFGVQKGALGAVLDNQGTAHDQATLMVELLRASGIEATYVRGAIKLDASQLASWYGIDTSNACAVANVLGIGQIPIYEINAVTGGACPGTLSPLVSVTLEHVWVKAKVDGSWVVFDPSFKTHSVKTGIELASPTTTGYNATTYLGSAISTSVNTADWVQNIGRTTIRNNLTNYASNLATYLRKNKPTATLDDVIGGKSIDQTYEQLRQTTLPYQDQRWTSIEYADLPNNFKSTLRIQYQGIDQTYTSDAIYGRRLSITYNAANQPVLKLDGIAVGAPGQAAAQGSATTINFSVVHNAYARPNANQIISQTLVAGGTNTYVIADGWGPSGRGPAENYRNVISSQRAAGAADSSEPLLGSTLAMVGAQWMAQADQAGLVAAQLSNSISAEHHRVGVVGYSGSVYVDLPGNRLDMTSKVGDDVMDSAAYLSWVMHTSILESTAVQQATGVSAVSTTKLIDLAAVAGQRIYSATASRFATFVQPELVNCANQLPAFNAAMAAGRRIVTPARCDITENNWSGAGYFEISPGMFSAMISGGMAGGFSTEKQAASAANTNVNNSQIPASKLAATAFTYSDPIDMLQGGFTYDHADIDVGTGDFPQTLTFRRSYKSTNRFSNGSLGKGWTNNFDASATTGSDGFKAMGESSALDAVGTVMEQKVSLDLLKNPALPVGTLVTAILGHKWFGDQLVDNTVIVTQGANGEVFVKLPDGTYNAPPGNSSRLTKNADGTFVYESLNRAVLKFNASGKAETYTDPGGVQVKYAYSTSGDLIQVQNTLGRTLTLTNANGRITSVANGPVGSGSGSGMVSYAYDLAGNLSTYTDALGKNTTFSYALPGLIKSIYYPGFPTVAAVTNTYDTLDRVSRQTNARGKSYDYYFAGSRTEEIGPGGVSRANYIDGQGNVIQSRTPLGYYTVNTYDGQSRLIRTELPEGNAVQYTYDDATCSGAEKRCTNNVLTISKLAPANVIGVAPLTQRFSYESAFNRVSSATDANGNVTRYTYTAQGLPLTVTSPVDASGVAPVTTYGYAAYAIASAPTLYLPTSLSQSVTADSQLVTVTSYNTTNKFVPDTRTVDTRFSGARLATTFIYDAVGNLISANGPGASLSTFSYNTARQVVQTSDASGVPTVTTYDADGRPISTATRIDAQGTQWMTACNRYSATGKVVRAWGPTVTSLATMCPAESAPVSITDTSYDDLDRVSLVTQNLTASQGGNRVSQTVYNNDDTLQAIKRAVGTPLEQTYATYVYTRNGNLQAILDAKNYATVFAYDSFDRRVRTYYPLPATVNLGNQNDYEETTYDANGNATALRKRNGQTVVQIWDKLNRLIGRNYPNAADNVLFTYDLRGLRTQAKFASGTHANSYNWDLAGRLTSATTDGRTLWYYYDASGNRNKLIWDDRFYVTTTYDSSNRPTQIREVDNPALATYTYDNLGRRTKIDWNNGATTAYQYNPQGLLNSLSHKLSNGSIDTTYARNQIGDITTVLSGDNSYDWMSRESKSRNYYPNGLNQYGLAIGIVFQHDANGNITLDGDHYFSYGSDNRLKKAGATVFDYDPEGRLRSVVDSKGLREFQYDGDKLVASFDASGNLVKRYVHGPGTDEPIVSYDGLGRAGKTWMLADNRGSVVATVDTNGQATAQFSYGPFGETGGIDLPAFMYTGQQYIFNPGLYYYKARFYDPAIGRFLQTDPVGTQDDLNLYAYVGNNPVNRVDPTGLAKVELGGAIQIAGVVFGHGDRHVDDPAAARIEILGNVPSSGLTPGAGFWGRTNNYEYRAMPLSNGNVNIGTYYYIPGR